MEIVRVSRNNWQVKVDDDDKDKIRFIAREFRDIVERPRAMKPYGYWESMESGEIWEHIIVQFCVMGSALRIEKLKKDKEGYREFLRRLSIENLLKQSTGRLKYISNQLKEYKACRFSEKTAERIEKCLKNQEIVKDGKVVLLQNLNNVEMNEDQMRAILLDRLHKLFHMKSVSDFMISIGAARNFIALDTRIIGLFKKHFNLNENWKSTAIQSNRNLYKSIEKELQSVCREMKVDLSILDRILFRSSGMSVIEYFMEKKYKKIRNSLL